MPRAFLLALPLLLAVGCKKAVPPAGPYGGDVLPPPAKDAPVAPPAVQQLVRNFERVHFAYDSATLSGESRPALTENAAILAANPSLVVEIQGHCDERGTTEYNLALGQKRAKAVKDFLVGQGVSPSRLGLVSYGEERPLDAREGDVAWAQNRRAEFRITAGGDGVAQGTTP